MGKRCLVYDIETTGLFPWESRIICVGVYDSEEDRSTVIWEGSEEETVRRFIRFVRRRGFDEVVGYNVSFDNRFVMAKCLEYEVPCGFFFEDPFHVDVMQAVRNPVDMYSGNSPGGLDDWTGYLFEDDKMEENGKVPELYEKGEYERIKEYCRNDVVRTRKLWRRLKDVGVL